MDELVSWVTRARAGDTTAYGMLVSRFQDMAYGYAYAILGDFDLAQDAAQEAFIEAYRCLPNLREPGAFPGWFKRIVFKHCDRLTRRKRPLSLPIEAMRDWPARQPGPAERVEQVETQASVLQAIGGLPAHEREVTALYYVDGYSQNEIAAFLEVPATTVKSRLYASRKRLKERMLNMVQDALKSNALPESFTRETLAQAVAKAAELNKQRQFGQAEDLLRAILGKSPNHPAALKELNRSLMWGQVYEHGRWDRLPELVEHGRQILAPGNDDESVYHETARTLLAIPAMPQAIEFIEGWIEKRGRTLDRLGMLAWAQGCVAGYDQAEALWNECLTLARDTAPQEAATVVQHVCMCLVDCFASAGEMARAARAAQAGWALCRDLDAFAHEYGGPAERRTDARWLGILYQAGLPLGDIARDLIARLGLESERDLQAQGIALSIRAWVDDVQAVTVDWLAWTKVCVEAGAWATLHHIGSQIGMTLRTTKRPDALAAWARATRQWLQTVPGKEARSLYDELKWGQFNGWAYLEAGDLDGAERVARQAMEEEGDPVFAVFVVDVAIRRGEPTPPDVVRFVQEKGVEAIDEYGQMGWYVIAREAAAAGDVPRAFEALQRAINYWSNPPTMSERWESDAYWGDLRDHPEYKRIYAGKRRRVGPIYGQLHYFPGW
jgi:RNA polymerase sigma factor (sigma-70 family)